MTNKTKEAQLLQVAICAALLAALVEAPFMLLHHFVNITVVLWVGEFYGFVTLMIGTVAIIGVVGGLNTEQTLHVCRVMFRAIYRLQPSVEQKETNK